MNEGMKELRHGDLWEIDGHVKTGASCIDLEDDDADQQSSGFTMAQKDFLVNSINKLMKLSVSELFRKPVNYFNIFSKPMDLTTMRSKLQNGGYPSVEALKADFDRMKHSSVANHKHTKELGKLKAAFESYMKKYPGQSDDCAPRNKAKTMKAKCPPAQTAARTGASSSLPRAARVVMQGQKYSRDHC